MDFAGFCRMFMFYFSGGMLLGLLGLVLSNKQNNERGEFQRADEFRLCRIFAERCVVVYPLLDDVASLPGTF